MDKKAHILKGRLILFSPAIIGSGADNETDFDLLTDAEGKPFIPGTSMAGVLRSWCSKYIKDKSIIDQLFGSNGGKNPRSSLLLFSDMPIFKEKVGKRAGVKIDNRIGRAEEKKLYEYQVIEEGEFELRIEAKTGNKDEEELVKKAFRCFNDLFREKIRIGAKTNSGYGEIGVPKNDNLDYYQFDLSKTDHLIYWLKREYDERDKIEVTCLPAFELDQKKKFLIRVGFKLKTSLIIRDYSVNPYLPDAISLKTGEHFVISGTALKGALRSRAERILNTLGTDEKKTEELLNNLFGYVEEKNSSEGNRIANSGSTASAGGDEEKKARKGRLRVNEVKLKDYPAEQQTRIKIDRFTGGTMSGALLEEMPVFSKNDGQIFNVKIEVDDYKDWEAGLLLLLLKDLWTGDLPVGGEKAIGRGVFEGFQAEIVLGDSGKETTYLIKKGDDGKLSINKKTKDGENSDIKKCLEEINKLIKAIQEELEKKSGESNE